MRCDFPIPTPEIAATRRVWTFVGNWSIFQKRWHASIVHVLILHPSSDKRASFTSVDTPTALNFHPKIATKILVQSFVRQTLDIPAVQKARFRGVGALILRPSSGTRAWVASIEAHPRYSVPVFYLSGVVVVHREVGDTRTLLTTPFLLPPVLLVFDRFPDVNVWGNIAVLAAIIFGLRFFTYVSMRRFTKTRL